MSYKSQSDSFTLLELLVVIAILAGIILLILPNYVSIREKARDTTRKNDLKEMQKALEMYRQDQTLSAYPTVTNSFYLGTCGAEFSGTNKYLSKIPCSPGSATPTPYYYSVNNATQAFSLCACLENKADPDGVTGHCDNTNYTCSSGYHYTVTTD